MFLLYGIMVTVCSGQVTKPIVADGLDTKVIPSGTFHFISNGRKKGDNLFHSFSKFSVPDSQTAFFLGRDGVANILSRVTGIESSHINGTIISPVNLFFINPNGVFFGPSARLNVNGSFHVSTADYLELADRVKFNAIPGPQDALLSSAPVKAFGFLSGNPASITVRQSTLRVANQKTLSVIGGKIDIEGGLLRAPGGQINIASAASVGEVVLAESSITMENFQKLGDIKTNKNTIISVEPSGSEVKKNSSIYIRGGKFELIDSNIIADNKIEVSKGIDIKLTGDFESKNNKGRLNSIRARPLGEVVGGGIEIKARNVQLNNTEITSQTQGFGIAQDRGDVGNINIEVDESMSMSNSFINTSTQGNENTGNAGDIIIEAGRLFVDNDSIITSISNSKGGAGNIDITTDSMSVANSATISSATGSKSIKPAGDVIVKVTKNLALNSRGRIISNTAGEGKAGGITVTSNNVLVSGSGSGISSSSQGKGDAGTVELKDVESLALSEGGVISTDSKGEGSGGNITVTSDNISISGLGSGISSSAQGKGDAGSVELKGVEGLTLTEGGVISTDSTGEGSGGDITVTSGTISLTGPGTAISSTSEGLKDAGSITVKADNIVMNDKASITTDASKANGGNINLNVSSLMHLIDSEITSSVKGGTDTEGGNITMNLKRGVLENSKIIANAFEGKGGNIKITAEVFLADPQSEVDASSDKGVDGEVDIRAPITNISGNVVPLKNNFSSATSLLLQPCEVRMSGGKRSSLVMAGRDGLPSQPGDLIPSPLYDEEMAAADMKMASMNERPPLAYGADTIVEKGLLPLDLLDGDSGCSTCP